LQSHKMLGSLSTAVLRSEGSRDEGRGKRQEEGVGSIQGQGKSVFWISPH
jgi:hypothetical protein